MLAECRHGPVAPGWEVTGTPVDACVHGPKQRTVGEVHGGAGQPPARAARDGLAEQLDVVEREAEDALVQWLLRRPDRRGERAGESAAFCLGA